MSATETKLVTPIATLRLRLSGLVQGRGIRPDIARLAIEARLTGSVQNASDGVRVIATGQPSQLRSFESELRKRFTTVRAMNVVDCSAIQRSDRGAINDKPLEKENKPVANNGFVIIESCVDSALATIVPTDVSICKECIDDIRNESSRRYRFPFTTCTRCGPRYSILSAMPYDRQRTSMNAFAMCGECLDEYRTPTDRRFHSQTNCCPNCGPVCWASDSNGNRLTSGDDAIQFVIDNLTVGKVVAIQGVGGYQLLCDATDTDVVERLRNRKRRPAKPFPVLVCDLDAASLIANINAVEADVLTSDAGPIVLLRQHDDTVVSPSINPLLREVGVMLPTSGLHWLIGDGFGKPVVCTSGNASGNPLAFQHSPATAELSEIADVFLHHNRIIHRPVDDSVVRCVAGKAQTIRSGRGLAPMMMQHNSQGQSIALGGHQKVAIGLSTPKHFVLGPHIGDMDNDTTRQRLCDQLRDLKQLFQVETDSIACDQHPGFFTSDLAGKLASDPFAVQHHHAHAAAAMWEHGLSNQTALALTFDGTGFGADETVWGGEALLVSPSGFQRVAHLLPFALPGGDAAIKQPWRVAVSVLSQTLTKQEFGKRLDALQTGLQELDLNCQTVDYMLGSAVKTSSMGRLFDAVASIVLGVTQSSFEGELAMRLEAICDTTETGRYKFLLQETDPIRIDWRPLIREVDHDCGRISAGRIAMKFHRAVADLAIEMATRFGDFPTLLCGGVFQNRVLLELVDAQAKQSDIDIRLPGKIPTGDGGLALGQLIVSAARQENESCV